MNVPDIPVQVPVDDPNADTEWNDILRKHGIIPEKPPSPTPMIEEALTQARQLAHENRLEGKDLDELAELEDEEDEDFLASYRQKRMAELAQISAASVYGQVYHLQKPDYQREVSDESAKAFVLALLTASGEGHTESRVAAEVWSQLATKFGDVKFCKIKGDMCIEGYPDRLCPTILVYKDGDIIRQIVTLKELAGVRTSLADFERLLVEIGAVAQGDQRLRSDGATSGAKRTSGLVGASTKVQEEDEDSDWD